MDDLHFSVWALPETPSEARPPGPNAVIHDVSLQTLVVSGEQLQTPLGVTFETAAERLTKIPQLYFEPDGSFLWVSRNSDRRWEMTGMLYDQGASLAYAEMRGCCPRAEMERVLACLSHAEQTNIIQFVRQGVFVEMEEFLRFCEAKHPR